MKRKTIDDRESKLQYGNKNAVSSLHVDVAQRVSEVHAKEKQKTKK